MYTTQRDALPFGVTLVRHYDTDFDLELQQCGRLTWWTQAVVQLRDSFWEYYDRPDGRNKFLEKIELHVYAPLLRGTPNWPSGFGGADCTNLGGGYSRIRLEWFDPSSNGDYKLAAALSHEVGHAFHNWTSCLEGAPWSPVFFDWYARQVTVDGVSYDPNAKPWREPRPGYRTENPFEQMANNGRFFFGTGFPPAGPRGVSGPGTAEEPLPGFVDPMTRPEWGRQLQLLPELAAYWDRYGLRGGLEWRGGTTGHFVFMNGAGRWVMQTDYYRYFEHDGYAWRQIWPSYSRY